MLQIPDMPTRAELEEREALMRIRAAELLGREPGADPGRAPRVARPHRRPGRGARGDHGSAARADVVVTGDPAHRTRLPRVDRGPLARGGRRRSFNGCAAAADPRQSRRPRGPPRSHPSRMADIETLEQQRFAHDRALEQLDTDLAAIDAVYNADFRYLPAHELTRAVHVLLDSVPRRPTPRGPIAPGARRCARRPRRAGPRGGRAGAGSGRRLADDRRQ